MWSTPIPHVANFNFQRWATAMPHQYHMWATCWPHVVLVWHWCATRGPHVGRCCRNRPGHMRATCGSHIKVPHHRTCGPHAAHMFNVCWVAIASTTFCQEFEGIIITNYLSSTIRTSQDNAVRTLKSAKYRIENRISIVPIRYVSCIDQFYRYSALVINELFFATVFHNRAYMC